MTIRPIQEDAMAGLGLFRRNAPSGAAAALALVLTLAPAGAADTVIFGSVGSASTNLWPVYIGIERLVLPGVTQLTD
jgi:hypothetical protein